MDTDESQRMEHGFWWGAVAAVVSGLVVLLAMALHLWPPRQPLSVLMLQWLGREYLGREGAPVALWVVAGVIHVTYGALSGAFLVMITDRARWSEVLGFGALRWFATNVLVAPTLGWGDFGFLALPAVSLATMLPHLAYAGSLGWLLRQEEAGRSPIPLHFHWPHLRPLHLGRTRRH
jgi:hypothetical protein